MASFGEKVDSLMNKGSMGFVEFIKENFHTTEKNAIVLVGVCIGVFLSLWLLACVVVAGNVCGSLSKVNLGSPRACCDSVKAVEAQEAAPAAEGGEAGDDDPEAPSVANTEGAYRSDSDSDDEGQGARLSKQAQKRARSMAGV